MKTQTINFLSPLSIREFKNLTIQVKETLMMNCKKSNHKIFSSAELWNIQKQRKNLTTRKFYY